MKIILETDRLILREFNTDDAPFILQLVNNPTWLEFIGDRGVKNLDDAKKYLINGPIKSYQENGFGLSMVEFKKDKTPIGMCGILKRETLDDADIGFAFMPQFAGKGYGYEIASATMTYAEHQLKLLRIVAITVEANAASIALLKKIGLRFEKTITMKDDDEPLMLFGTPPKHYQHTVNTKHQLHDFLDDKAAIDDLTRRFFDLFTNTNGDPKVHQVHNLFIPQGLIIKNTGPSPEIYNLQQFIEPREKILTDGTLTEFSEKEVSEKTEIFGNIAHRFSMYHKSGTMSGQPFESKGMKTIQFIKTRDGWKMSSLAWDDQQE